MILALAAVLGVAAQDTGRIADAQAVLSQLVEIYGVSGAEAPVAKRSSGFSQGGRGARQTPPATCGARRSRRRTRRDRGAHG